MDFYSLLGVPRNASLADIERAYRRVARRYHPGVNPGDRVAEEMYRGIQEAYGVLADAERRREYDHRGYHVADAAVETVVAFEGFDFSASGEGGSGATFSELFADVFQTAAREATTPSRGSDIELTVGLTFLGAARGTSLPVSLTRRERCPACAGQGQVTRPPVSCPACAGGGSRRWTRGHMVFTKPCEICAGEGRVSTVSCRACRGVGVATRTEVVTLAIPAGVESGARLAVPGRGHAGAREEPAGDLYVTVDVADHPFFRREGNDLHVALPVAVHEAALGARVDVPTLSGTVELTIPAGTASGDRLVVRGEGIGGRTGTRPPGDLVAEVQIVLPPVIDERSRELLKEFGRRNEIDVRRHLFAPA